MAVTFTNVSVENIGTVFEVSKDSTISITVEGGEFKNANKLFNERDPVSLYEYVGLPSGTPVEYVHELLLELLRQSHNASVGKDEVVKSSKLWGYVENMANASSILESLVGIASQGSGVIATLISKFPS